MRAISAPLSQRTTEDLHGKLMYLLFLEPLLLCKLFSDLGVLLMGTLQSSQEEEHTHTSTHRH